MLHTQRSPVVDINIAAAYSTVTEGLETECMNLFTNYTPQHTRVIDSIHWCL